MGLDMNERKHAIWKNVLKIFPLIFFVELILGGSGNIVSIGGISIRKILLVIAFASLCAYIVFSKVRIEWKLFDTIVLAFILWNFVWMTLIPALKGTGIRDGIADGDTVLLLLIYFPLIILIRSGVINWGKVKKFFYVLAVILAVWHIVMYTLETLMPGIYIEYYNLFLPKITFGSFPGATPVLGFGFVRIITTTSIYMPIAIFFIAGIKRKKVIHYAFLLILVFGVITTLTRSLLISCLAGFLLLLIPIHKNMININWFGKLTFVVSLFVISLVFNYLFITPMSGKYIENVSLKNQQQMSDAELSVIKGESEEEQGDLIKRIGSSASENDFSNILREAQTQILIQEWKKSPVIGFGYGSYVEGCIRNGIYAYLYESTLPAMLMKLGILGLAGWVMLTVAMIVNSFKNKYSRGQHFKFWTWMITCIIFAMSVQTNPFLYTYCGLSIILFLCIESNAPVRATDIVESGNE